LGGGRGARSDYAAPQDSAQLDSRTAAVTSTTTPSYAAKRPTVQGLAGTELRSARSVKVSYAKSVYFPRAYAAATTERPTAGLSRGLTTQDRRPMLPEAPLRGGGAGTSRAARPTRDPQGGATGPDAPNAAKGGPQGGSAARSPRSGSNMARMVGRTARALRPVRVQAE
jgi:hypothetical protein